MARERPLNTTPFKNHVNTTRGTQARGPLIEKRLITPTNRDHHASDMNTAATKLGLWPTALALIACYGTLCLVSLLALAGITLPINEGLWAVAIAAFPIHTDTQ